MKPLYSYWYDVVGHSKMRGMTQRVIAVGIKPKFAMTQRVIPKPICYDVQGHTTKLSSALIEPHKRHGKISALAQIEIRLD